MRLQTANIAVWAFGEVVRYAPNTFRIEPEGPWITARRSIHEMLDTKFGPSADQSSLPVQSIH